MSVIHLEWNPVEQQLESLRALVEELRSEVGESLAENAELRREAGYWQSLHARAIERNMAPKKKRGRQPGSPSPKRRDYSHLPARIQEVDVPDDAKVCACYGLPLEGLGQHEDSVRCIATSRSHDVPDTLRQSGLGSAGR